MKIENNIIHSTITDGIEVINPIHIKPIRVMVKRWDLLWGFLSSKPISGKRLI